MISESIRKLIPEEKMKLMVFIIMVCIILQTLNEIMTFVNWLRGKISKGASVVAEKSSVEQEAASKPSKRK